MAVISVEDVATAIGRPIEEADETAQVEQWISDVEMLVFAKVGDLDVLDQSMLGFVEREVVVDWMRHRDESTEADRQSRGVYFRLALDPWWSLLAADRDGQAATASIRPTFEPDYGCPTDWWTCP